MGELSNNKYIYNNGDKIIIPYFEAGNIDILEGEDEIIFYFQFTNESNHSVLSYAHNIGIIDLKNKIAKPINEYDREINSILFRDRKRNNF
jgi:hypothetical protein